jgi:hypothetical protein
MKRRTKNCRSLKNRRNWLVSPSLLALALVTAPEAEAAVNLTQSHYRWRNDDGSEGGLNTGSGAAQPAPRTGLGGRE